MKPSCDISNEKLKKLKVKKIIEIPDNNNKPKNFSKKFLPRLK